jgi:hypothetical protein
LKVHKEIPYAEARKAAYMPIEDQLEAVINCLEYLGNNGIDIGLDIQEIIDHRKTIKDKFVKKTE